MASNHSDVLGLGWLVQPRWGAGVAFLVALGLSQLGFLQPMHPAPILLGATVTLVTNYVAPRLGQQLGIQRLAVGLLLFDTIALTTVLFFTGGASNPLTALYMIPIAMGAMMLARSSAWVLAAAAVVAFGALFFAPGHHVGAHSTVHGAAERTSGAGTGMGDMGHRAHPQHGDHTSPADTRAASAGAPDASSAGQVPEVASFDLHLRGMWVAFTLTAVLVTYFVTRVAGALRTRDEQLAQTRARAERAERVASLASLAASTAHELGTPFASISLAASEMKHAISRGNAAAQLEPDVDIVRSQVKRCREILDTMLTEAGETVGEAPTTVAARQIVLDAVAMLPEADRTRVQSQVDENIPMLNTPRRLVAQSVHNLLRNALDASPLEAPVSLTAMRSGARVRFTITDTGVGMDSHALAEAMEPFVTSKPDRGQGLGLFLTQAVADRLGGGLTLTSEPGKGTSVVFEILLEPLPLTAR